MFVSRCLFKVILVAVMLVAHGSVLVHAADRDEVNRFYQEIVGLFKSCKKDRDVSAKAIAELVQKNPAAAKVCLEQARAKCNAPGKEGQALRQFCDRLEEASYLVSGSDGCDETIANRALERFEARIDDRAHPCPWTSEEKLFVLENLARRCPRLAGALHLLGDQYMEERRMGMAIETYRKALALKDDPDSKKLLARAEELMKRYQEGQPIVAADIHDLFVKRSTMGVAGVTRKVKVEERIQRQILFDEWSDRVKGKFVPELQVVAAELKKNFAKEPDVGLLIEGHSDSRGDPDRNMKVSQDRAESVKRFLVERSSVDPSRIQVKGFGPSRPYDPREDDTGYALNRRVEFKMINLSAQK
jgi:outer membrane protein OmpA-like peptidoglycan-associated protein